MMAQSLNSTWSNNSRVIIGNKKHDVSQVSQILFSRSVVYFSAMWQLISMIFFSVMIQTCVMCNVND